MLALSAAPLIRIAAAELTGTATAITGDTLRVAGLRIRLWGISAPPLSDFGGYSSMQALARLVADREVTCVPAPPGRRGPVERCTAAGKDLAAEMVSGGFARDCPEESRGLYAREEQQREADVAGGMDLPETCRAAE